MGLTKLDKLTLYFCLRKLLVPSIVPQIHWATLPFPEQVTGRHSPLSNTFVSPLPLSRVGNAQQTEVLFV